MNTEPDALPGIGVEIGMRMGESLRLSGGRLAKAVDIVMAVAFGMGDAEEGAEGEVLLHGEPGLAGEVFTGDEERFPRPRSISRRASR